MLILQLVFAVVLLLVCGFSPGFYFIRRLRWRPMEKLCGSIAASFVLLYLAFWVLYLISPVGTDIPRWALAFVSIACCGAAVLARRDLVQLFCSFRVRQALAGFSFLMVWTFVLLAIIRLYSGADWFGDWAEHFQRTLFFLHHFPAHSPILMGYALPSRPPAMNELAAFFLGQTGDRFEIFQLVCSFLNLLMFLPGCLILPALAGPRRTFLWPLTGLFALNPVVCQNVTYTWTKAFAAFYVVLALWLYLAGWKKKDSLRMLAAFVMLCMGLLVHYSAAPYLLFVTLHYLLLVFPKREARWPEITAIAVTCGLLLATWFGWSMLVFGIRGTVASNTSVTLSAQDPVANVVKMTANVFDSIVPVLVRDAFLLDGFSRQGRLGMIRDDAFIFYQTNLPFSMGLVGGPVVLCLLYGMFFRRRPPGMQRGFWLCMVPFCVIVGIASVGERGLMGKAHLALLPVEILGLSFLAASFPLRRALLTLVIVGCLIDFSFGILLHAHVQSLENLPQKTIFPSLSSIATTAPSLDTSKDSLAPQVWNNWIVKHQYEQIVDLSRSLDLNSGSDKAQLQGMLRDDETYWHGWYSRNGGSMRFLGDHFGGEFGRGTSISESILVLFALGIATHMFRRSRTSPAVTADRLRQSFGAGKSAPAGWPKGKLRRSTADGTVTANTLVKTFEEREGEQEKDQA